MGRAFFALVVVGCLACIVAAQGSGGAGSFPGPCSPYNLYFDGLYYRTLALGKTRPDTRSRVGTGTYLRCDSRAPMTTPLRKLAGVSKDVALRDGAHPRRLYVSNEICAHRGGHALFRCLRRTRPAELGFLAPPGFAATGDRYALLDYSSSCWEVTRGHIHIGTCIDIAWPGDGSDLPAVPVSPGGTIRFELGFEPGKAALFLHRSFGDFDRVELTPSRAMTWNVPQDLQLPKFFEVRALKDGSGEGAYIGRFVEATSTPTG